MRLSYEDNGRRQNEVAPLRVWIDQGVLDVAAYDVRIRQGRMAAGDDILTAWIEEPSTNNFDSQVLQKVTAPGRPKLEVILEDSVLADRLQAGLAGPPPQLEWLFADEPMKHLFDDRHRFQMLSREFVEGNPCHVVRVDVDGERYRFWIDQKQGVIRRVELPSIHLAPERSTPTTMTLTLELAEATFGSPQKSLPTASLPKRPRLLTRFIPLPPLEPSRILGTRPHRFRMNSRDGTVALDSSQVRGKILVLGRFVGGEASIANVALLQNWNSRLPAEISTRLRMVVMADHASVSQIPRELTLQVAIDEDQIASRQLSLPPSGLTILDDQGHIAWMISMVSPDSLVAAGTILGDLIKGIDVPARLREQWQNDVRRYRDALGEVSVVRPVPVN